MRPTDKGPSTAPQAPPYDALRVRDSEYVYLMHVASGGMGRVDLALRTVDRFQRLYAVKHMHPHLARDERSRAMFAEEARLAGAINHPNVVGVLDYGEDDFAPYMVMDYVEGLTLAELLRIGRDLDPLPLSLGLRIARDVARGLHAIHVAVDPVGRRLGLVHRDLSPRNVLLGFDGSVRITDFGIARAEGREIETTVGLLKGTPGYVAPERLLFEVPTEKSDLFSLGVLSYEMLTSEPLYAGPLETTAPKILGEAPPDLGELRPDSPPMLVALLLRLLAKRPDQRPASAEGVAHILDELMRRQEGPESVDLGCYLEVVAGSRRASHREKLDAALSAPRPASKPRRGPHRGWMVAGALSALALVGGLLLGSSRAAEVPTPPPAAASADAVKASTPALEPEPEPETEPVPAVPAPEVSASASVRRAPPAAPRTSPKVTRRSRAPRRRARRSKPTPKKTTVPREMTWSGTFE